MPLHLVIYINQPLTSHKIMEILEENPEIEKITCPPSIYKRITPRYIEALSKLGVKVEPVTKRGRPKKYSDKDQENINNMVKQGHPPRKISDVLNIPLKTVYYFIESPLKRGRKPKYSFETEQKVKTMYRKGHSVKEISENLDIPLRSVYSLLNKGKD
jgi:hypothetical protein